MIAGFEDITYGRLYIDGAFVNNVEPKDRSIAMVFQNYALYPHMSVYENLAFALELRKIPCPIYEPCEEVKPIDEEISNIKLEIKKVKKAYTKNQNSKELLDKYIDLYNKLFELVDKKQKLLKPVMGIDEYKIKALTKENVELEKDIALIAKKQSKFSEDKEFMSISSNVLDQKKTQIEENKKNIEYLSTHEVPLYEMRHLTKDEMDIKINRVSSSIDLTKYLFRTPGALSGGQRQRVALGRAIVREPKVFLMDEPLSNLDAKLRVQTRGEITKIHKKVGATTIYVTHDQTEAMTMADRIVVMKDGYIQQVGTPEEIYEKPANTFVAGFIGNPPMNFINGVYSKGEFIVRDNKNPIKIKLSTEYSKKLKEYEGKEIILGVRPENVCFSSSEDNKKLTAKIPAICDYYELLGHEFVAYCYLGEQQVTLKCSTNNTIKEKSNVDIYFNMEKLYFFDVETTKRIGE